MLIALTAEQLAENFRDRHMAGEARSNIQAELRINLKAIIYNQAAMAAQERQLEENLALLDSNVSGERITAALHYEWDALKPQDSAWNAARLNGSLALIRPEEVAEASYFYENVNATDPEAYGYFTDMDAAAAIADHARSTGILTFAMREQLIAHTISAVGRCRMSLKLLAYERKALEDTDLIKEAGRGSMSQ